MGDTFCPRFILDRKQQPAFPIELLETIYDEASLQGSLCNQHSSGLVVLKEYSIEHMKSGKPIFYTSADSVFQIAAHEETFGSDALYLLCTTVFRHTAPLNIARVIARPFIGNTASDFKRTDGRRDYSIKPPESTLLDRLKAAGRDVCAIGKVADIFAHQGVTDVIKAHGNNALFNASLKALGYVRDGGLIFTNFVDFDQLYGHRRDVAGYAAALEKLDGQLEIFINQMRADDVLIITADHGCDPTWPGTEHTRERVPVLVFGRQVKTGSIGIRDSFADVGESIAALLDIEAGQHGVSFL